MSRVSLVKRRRRVTRRRGGSFFSSIGNALSNAHNFIKSNRIISTVGSALGAVGVPYAGALGRGGGPLGYRRRRVGVRRGRVGRRGGDLRTILSGVHKFVKGNRL